MHSKKYITEFLGTFFLMFTIMWVVHVNYIPSGLKPSVIGLILMILIYWGGPISKAHYNPAVTIAFITRRQMDPRDILGYLIAEFFAAFFASWLGMILFAENCVAHVFEIGQLPMALLGEFLGTFVIVSVIMFVATLKRTIGNRYYGFAIALAVTLMIYAFAHLSGGAFNPAVALGFVLCSMIELEFFLMVILVCFLGGWVSGKLFNLLEKRD